MSALKSVGLMNSPGIDTADFTSSNLSSRALQWMVSRLRPKRPGAGARVRKFNPRAM